MCGCGMWVWCVLDLKLEATCTGYILFIHLSGMPFLNRPHSFGFSTRVGWVLIDSALMVHALDNWPKDHGYNVYMLKVS